MREQDEFGIDGYQGKYPERELPDRNLAVEGGVGGQSTRLVVKRFGLPGRLVDWPRLSLFLSLLLAIVVLAAPIPSPAQVSVGLSVTFAPPALPIYAQPLCPGPGFIWIPGYWAWDPDIGYYWVPGMWVLAPFVGALWTPGYWGWSDGVFIWYEGYWGPVVGFYGGINYGFGYTGFGYHGGYWKNDAFYYNRAVNNVNVTNITTVYSQTVTSVRPRGVSFNGGPGGVTARPTSEQLAAASQKRSSLTDAQKQQMKVAAATPKQRATVNHGRPAIAATAKPGVFTGRGVTTASRAGAPYKTPSTGGKTAPGERVGPSRPGPETHAPTTTHDRTAPKASQQKEPAGRVREPHTAPQRPETVIPTPKEKTKGEKGDVHPPVTTHERMAPKSPQQKEPVGPVHEPHTAPQRPEALKPTKGEREEQR